MKIIARVKDDEFICGYIIELNDGTHKYVKRDSLFNNIPDNAIMMHNGEWKAKKGYSIKTINKNSIALEINNRNTPIVGKPHLIYNYNFAKLSKTQQYLINALKNDKIISVDKHKDNMNIKMTDLSAMTAYTGLEYSLFARNDKFIIVAGTPRGVFLREKEAIYLLNNKYVWVGHTHPGNTFNCLIPSDSDYDTLHFFNQKQSVIFNSVGEHYLFGEEKEI